MASAPGWLAALCFFTPAQAQVEEVIPSRPRAATRVMFAPSASIVKTMPPGEMREDRRFLKDAAAAGRFRSEAARLALARSTNPAVRSHAAALAAHYAAAAPQLQYLLHVRDLAAPMLANDQRRTLNRLSRLHGAKFDQTFMEELGVRSQLERVQAFERASLSTRDPQLRAWIDRTLPAMRDQLAALERDGPSQGRVVRGGAAAGAPTQAPALVSRASVFPRSMPPGVASESRTR